MRASQSDVPTKTTPANFGNEDIMAFGRNLRHSLHRESSYLSILLNNMFRCWTKEHIEVQYSTNSSVCQCWHWLQRHICLIWNENIVGGMKDVAKLPEYLGIRLDPGPYVFSSKA